ncbi:hypothetical protein [Methanogenium cariaci]|uniref:hypothetical protein n=1 Tax=Methanogenium cariaci TaxID=2197 RepID=UPI0007818AEA|nr:hypothetical protein [Methanogenium cariaci]
MLSVQITLYGYDNSEIIVHITRNILKITSNEVTKVYPDSKGRWWFITKGGEAGYYFSDNTTEKIPVAMVNESVSEDSGMSEPSAPIRLAVHYVSDPL